MKGMFFAQRDMKWNLDITKGQGNSFSYILLLLGQGYCSLYQGLCYIEVRYVEVPLYVYNFFSYNYSTGAFHKSI